MAIDNNGPAAPYPGPAEPKVDTGEGHGSGIEEADSEPKQGQDLPEDETLPIDPPPIDEAEEPSPGSASKP